MSVTTLITRGLLVILLVATPGLVQWLTRRVKLLAHLGPVLLCYGIGLLLGNQPLASLHGPTAMGTGAVAIALGIPLLLFTLDLRAWVRLARPTLLSFAAILAIVVGMSALGYLLFRGRVEHARPVAAMMVGVYSGGTPNLAAIGTALGVPPRTFVLVNTADILVGALYLGFLFLGAAPLTARLLPPFRSSRRTPATPADPAADAPPTWRSGALGFGLALAVAAAGFGLAALLPWRPLESTAILSLTTLAILASLVPAVRRVQGTYALGEYVLLVFCVAIGSTADLSRLDGDAGWMIAYVAFVMVGSAVLHLGVAALLRIDRDTALMTSTAAIYGPAFIGPMAVVLKNREVVFTGLACSLVGLGVANYLGLALHAALG